MEPTKEQIQEIIDLLTQVEEKFKAASPFDFKENPWRNFIKGRCFHRMMTEITLSKDELRVIALELTPDDDNVALADTDEASLALEFEP